MQYQFEILPQLAQDNNYNILVASIWPEMNYSEIPQLESDSNKEEEEQFEDAYQQASTSPESYRHKNYITH